MLCRKWLNIAKYKPTYKRIELEQIAIVDTASIQKHTVVLAHNETVNSASGTGVVVRHRAVVPQQSSPSKYQTRAWRCKTVGPNAPPAATVDSQSPLILPLPYVICIVCGVEYQFRFILYVSVI